MQRTAPLPVESHKQRLLNSGTRLFYFRGYHGTTVDAILADAGVPKGSFYHHFGSKEAFGLAVLDRYVATQEDALNRWAQRDDLIVPDRLAGYHREMVAQFVASDWRHPCLAGKLSNELALHSTPYRDRTSAAFRAWSRQIADLLADGQQRHEVRLDLTADQLADAVLAMVQGAFVAALSLRDRDYLDSVTAGIVDLITAST